MRATTIATAVSVVIAETGRAALWTVIPMTIPSAAKTRQEIAGMLLKLSAMTACAAPRPTAAIAKIHAVAERALRATLSRILHVVTAQSNPKDGTTSGGHGRGTCIRASER